MIIPIITAALTALGLYFILADAFCVPYYLSSKAIVSVSHSSKKTASGFSELLEKAELKIAGIIRINEYKMSVLAADLRTAQMEITPQRYVARAIVKALLVGVFALPAIFIFPISVPVIILLAVFLYNSEMKKVSRKIKKKREKIDYELPRLVFTVEKTLKHSRDVLYMLESYMENAGDELKHELSITTADMRSGNYEAAITRMEGRVGTAMMSDVCRGLIGILRGDNTRVYFATLAVKFNDIGRQKLKSEANKIPKKVKKLSVCLLVCFVLIYAVVIISEIMSSLSTLFM